MTGRYSTRNGLPEDRLQVLCDGYVLGALDGEELEEMRAALANREAPMRETVRKFVRASEEAAALIALGAPQITPPAGLRRRVLAAVEAGTSKSANAGGTDGTHILAMTTSEDKRKARSRPFLWLGWAAAAALALVAVLVGGRVRQAEQDLAEARAEVEDLRLEVATRDRVLAVIGARDSRTIRLVTAAPEAPQFRAYWSESAGLVLTGANVPTVRAGRTLQLWIVPKQGAPTSAGVLAPGPRGGVLLIASNTPSPDGAQALAISDEPQGGSAQPTTPPAWVGAVGGF